MKVSGLTISNMATVLSPGQMVLATKVSMRMARKKERVGSHSQTDHTMKDNSAKMRSLVSAITTGPMVSPIAETGAKTRWMATEYSPGKTARSMMVTLSTIREKVTELSYGLMVVSTLESGRPASNTDLEPIFQRIRSRSRVSGRTVEKSDGLETTTSKKRIDYRSEYTYSDTHFNLY